MVTDYGSDYAAQQQLIATLHAPAFYPHAAQRVRVLETHISWVLLAGRRAYKIKKAISLGFLDFTNLDARRRCCEEEIRLNRRLAPRLYLDAMPIGGSPEQPQLDALPAIEYAVRMRRFPANKVMDRLLLDGRVTPEHIDRLAETIARFHAGLPPAPDGSPYGTPQAVHASAVQNFDQLAALLDTSDQSRLARLRQASEAEYASVAALLEVRRQQGWIRECHGDLHLGNIVLLDGAPTPFDGIDFNANLRWIDVISEVAFLVMDLLYRQRTDLAWRFLDGYLQLTGDYAGVGVLRYYLAYRAMVRAKIAAIRARQLDTPTVEAESAMHDCRAYLALAESCLQRPCPLLVITHGLPGSGKTTVAREALQRLGAIRIRSDVERKRLHSLAPLQSSRSSIGGDMYSAEATRRTYARLHALARDLLAAGHNVIVDAAFLRQAERMQFRALANELGTFFTILDVHAEPATLRQRIAQRQESGRDASEADLQVLEALQAVQEPLQADELPHTIAIANNGSLAATAIQPASWEALQRPASIPALLAKFGGSDAEALGITLDGLRPDAVYQWFLATLLYGARISHTLATRTWREFARCDVLTPQKMVDTGWEGLVKILDRGGYARYDYKTATKLLEASRNLLTDYGGDLNALHATAADAADLERRIRSLAKGIGPLTAAIFLRELRGRWDKAKPLLSPPAYAAALEFGLLPAGTPQDAALHQLQQLWKHSGKAARDFCTLEALLVRAGLRRQRRNLPLTG